MMTAQPAAPRGKIPARVLDLAPWPLAGLEALLASMVVQLPLTAPLLMLLLHDARMPARLRAPRRWLLSWPTGLRAVAATTAWSAGWREVALAATALLTIQVLVMVSVRGLIRRGHFMPRVALVGARNDTDRLAQQLSMPGMPQFRVAGQFEPTAAALQGLTTLGAQHSLDCVMLTGMPEQAEATRRTLERVKHLSAPIVLVEAMSNGQQIPACIDIDDLATDGFLALARNFGEERFGYAVTPNADHLVRLEHDQRLREAYREADFVLLDSRFLANWLRLATGRRWQVAPGSDLTARLFCEVVQARDRIVMIGGRSQQADRLRLRHGLRHLHQHIPPMGFIRDQEAVETCLKFIERHSPFRYCLLAIGSPQQEIIAARLKSRGKARGLALCVGASLDFLTGETPRAPRWMRRIGLEWLHRLLHDPRRLARRYLVEGPRVFGALRRHPLRARTPALTLPTEPAVVQRNRIDTDPRASQRRTG